ncbi:hypothetical protein GCM10017624_34560 [Azotobacter vinelandii]|nr:hypothetical protein GCM10017624_34560 [Azotobacter vinelandii]
MHKALGLGGSDILWGGLVREVEGHQGFEATVRRACGLDALPIGARLGRVAYGWNQIGHDDGATERACCIRHRSAQGGTIAKMNMPVIRA